MPDDVEVTCTCSSGPPDHYWTDTANDAARHIAYGIEHGAWACDCVDWDDEDATAAYAHLYHEEASRRDKLREGIHKLEREGLITVARGDKILIDARLPADSLHRAALRAKAPTLPRVSAYAVEAPPHWEHERIEIVATGKLLAGGRWDGAADVWAIRKRGWCLTRDGAWEYEPQPSSRDDEFFSRCRFKLAEALPAAQAAMDAWVVVNRERIAAHLVRIGDLNA